MKQLNIKRIILIALISLKGFCQSNPAIENSLPKIAPPSPTVAALMKFEEVPADNYTGIPDVSIPIYSIGTYSKDITINLSLKYHPLSIAVNEDASYTGLGWSLFGGGTISRTARGLPDDYNINGIGRIGIYGQNNPYYNGYLGIGPNPTPYQKEVFNEFLWEVAERGKYDSEHDLYQFNFMGHSGRFYIKKNGSNYEVVKLDNNNAIKITYDSTLKIFILFDDLGNSFHFDVKEETIQSSGFMHHYFGSGFPLGGNLSEEFNYISAFHLSKVYDRNDNLLIEIEYNDENIEPMIENSVDGSRTVTTITSPIGVAKHIETLGAAPSELQKLDPRETRNASLRITHTRKMKQIRVQGKAKIDFILDPGRTDTDNEGTYRLTQIKVKNWTDTVTIKKFRFSYENLTMNIYNTDGDPRKRMLLKKVTESDAVGNYPQTYELEYEAPQHPSTVYTLDYWGYPNSKQSYEPPFMALTTNPSVCTTGVLQKMKLPSGGAIVFNYEANTYSHVGDQTLTNFDENPDNWDYEQPRYFYFTSPVNGGATQGQLLFMPDTYERHVTFVPYSTVADGQPGSFMLYKVVNGVSEFVTNINCQENDGSCSTVEMLLQAGVSYKVTFNWLNISQQGSGSLTVYSRYRNNNNFQYLYGGGIRIKNIGYFENGNVSRRYYDGSLYQDGYLPAKQKNYDYRQFEDILKSSGSLVYPRPVYVYHSTKEHEIVLSTTNSIILRQMFTVSYEHHTNFNRLNPAKTRGSDVGYKNVTVWETGNGKSKFTYTSAWDYPEVINGIGSTFLPSPNYDYKRGLLKKEEHSNEAEKLLSETTYAYEIDEGTHSTGHRIGINIHCPYMYDYASAAAYYDTALYCASSPSGYDCSRQCGLPAQYIGQGTISEAYGWPKMVYKENKQYFYTNTNTVQGTVVTKDSIGYYDFNKRIAWQETTTYNVTGSEETVRADFFYTNWVTNNNLSHIETIENRKNGSLIGKQHIIYAAFPGIASSLPATVQASKGDLALENRVQFVKYDSWSNPLEVKLENGTPVSYIWGYNKTQPIAMIENATYEELATALGTTVANIRDYYSEANLTAINNLRNTLQNAMVTTYIYKPLVGVATVTDPKGMATTYEYDGMGRLKAVKDQDGNLLSENEYHYRMP